MGGGMGGGSGGGMGGGMRGGMMGGVSETNLMDVPESKSPTTRGRSAASSRTTRRPAARPTTATAAAPETAERKAIFHLQISINQELKPAALEFQKAVIENLRDSLTYAYQEQKNHLENEREIANEQLLNAEQQLQEVNGIDAAANTET